MCIEQSEAVCVEEAKQCAAGCFRAPVAERDVPCVEVTYQQSWFVVVVVVVVVVCDDLGELREKELCGWCVVLRVAVSECDVEGRRELRAQARRGQLKCEVLC